MREEKQMKKKTVNKRLIAYEVKNILGNPFIPIFGIGLPTLMLFLITKAAEEEVPKILVSEVNTQIFISLSSLIPMAVILIGYGANYAQELEKEIPLRMKLFGFSDRVILEAKLAAEFLVMTVGFFIYTAVAYCSLEMQVPKVTSALFLLFCLYLSGAFFLFFAHGVATFFRRFGPTYAVTMAVYFGIMILCGMMGIKTEQLPKALRALSKLLPMSYISNDFIGFWQGGSYSAVPLLQAFLFFGAVSGIVLYLSLRKRR